MELLTPEPVSSQLGEHSGDQDREASRMFRRTVFDFERWREHRSISRYGRHIASIPSSRIVQGLSVPLAWVAALTVAVGCYETAREGGQLPAGFPSLSIVNTDPFNLSSFALSLLLVFRTNESFARWVEARMAWGRVIKRSRDLMRQAEVRFPEAQRPLLAMLRRWTVAFSASLQTHLREEGDIETALKGILEERELAALAAADHRPNYALAVLTRTVERADIPEFVQARLEEDLTVFEDALGMCERILKQPIPLTYTRHTSRFLVMFLAFLPFTLWHACGWGAVPGSVGIAFLLLGIEEIGVQIEEPFSILPLDYLCATIARDCTEMHAWQPEINQLVEDCGVHGSNGSNGATPT